MASANFTMPSAGSMIGQAPTSRPIEAGQRPPWPPPLSSQAASPHQGAEFVDLLLFPNAEQDIFFFQNRIRPRVELKFPVPLADSNHDDRQIAANAHPLQGIADPFGALTNGYFRNTNFVVHPSTKSMVEKLQGVGCGEQGGNTFSADSWPLYAHPLCETTGHGGILHQQSRRPVRPPLSPRC